MDMLSSLRWRYATKVFDPTRVIPQEDLDRITDALVLTPSSYGLQPWRFLVIRDHALRAELRPASYGQAQITDSSHLVVLCRPGHFDTVNIDRFITRTSEVQGRDIASLSGYRDMMVGDLVQGPRSHAIDAWMRCQVYIALGNLLTTVASMGIDACPMEGFDPARYDAILGLEARGLASVVLCAIGYRSPEDVFASLPKVRYEKSDVIEML